MPQLAFSDDEQGLVSRHFNAGVDSALISVTNDHCCCSNHTFCSQRDFMQPAVFSLSLWVLPLHHPSIFSLFQSLCILSLSPLSDLIHRLIYVSRTIKLARLNWTQLLGRHQRSIKGSGKALSALHRSSIHSSPKSNLKPLRMLSHPLFNTGSCCIHLLNASDFKNVESSCNPSSSRIHSKLAEKLIQRFSMIFNHFSMNVCLHSKYRNKIYKCSNMQSK